MFLKVTFIVVSSINNFVRKNVSNYLLIHALDNHKTT